MIFKSNFVIESLRFGIGVLHFEMERLHFERAAGVFSELSDLRANAFAASASFAILKVVSMSIFMIRTTSNKRPAIRLTMLAPLLTASPAPALRCSRRIGPRWGDWYNRRPGKQPAKTLPAL